MLYAGHSRWRAALEINKRKLTPVPFKLRCVYFRGTEHQAFMATVRENRDRNETTAIDDAHNIAKLERYGMTLDDIAATVYHEDLKWVKDRLTLIDLCAEAYKAFANNELKPKAAVALAKLSKEAQKDWLKKGDKATVAAIKRAAAPQPQESTSEGSAAAPAVQKPRRWDRKQFVDLIEAYLEMDLPAKIKGLSCENAVRIVLRAR